MSDFAERMRDIERRLFTLGQQQDTRVGSAITSHRPWVGPVVVGAKRAFRRLMSPFINEALRPQAEFNARLVESLQAVQEVLQGAGTRVEERLDQLGLAAPVEGLSPEELARRRGRMLTSVPVELLFTEGPRRAPIEHWTEAWQAQHQRWADLPLVRLAPHLGLYRFFMGQRADPQPYLDWYEAIFASRGLTPPLGVEALLATRHRDYLAMERRLETGGVAAFSELPITVDYNQRGYFNIRDGHHRAAFLVARGRRHMVVEMTTEDFAFWQGRHLDAVRELLYADGGQRLVYTPMLLPGLLDYPSERDGAAPSRLDLILESLGERRLAGLGVLDIGCNVGFYGRHFAREGAKVTGIDLDPKHIELGRRLNQAHQLEFELRCEPFEDADLEPHDLGLLLTVLYHYGADVKRRTKLLEKVDATVRRWLYWESGAEPEKEKRWLLEGTHFDQYRKLGDTWGTGKRRELGVFFVGGDAPDGVG